MNTLKKSTNEMRDLYVNANDSGLMALKNVNDNYQSGSACIRLKSSQGDFISYCKHNNIGQIDSIHGGYTIQVNEDIPSLKHKIEYASAFAEVLRNAGLNAYSESSMD